MDPHHHNHSALFSAPLPQTDQLKQDIRQRVLMQDLEEIYARPTYNHTAMTILSNDVTLLRENTTRAISSLETILYWIRMPNANAMKQVLGVSGHYKQIAWHRLFVGLSYLFLFR